MQKTITIPDELVELLQELADRENRNLKNYLENLIINKTKDGNNEKTKMS